MSSYNKFNCFVQDLHEGKHDFRSDIVKIVLSNTQPLSTNSVLADIAEIEDGGGYASGGIPVVITSSSQTGGVYRLKLQDKTFTATGTVQAFRYIVLYNSSTASGNLISWYDHGSVINLQSGESYFFDFDQESGLYSLS